MTGEQLAKVFGTNLRVMMARKGFSAKSLADASGISRNTINTLRKGEMKMVQLNSIAKVCNVLKIYPEELFHDELLRWRLPNPNKKENQSND